MFGLDDIAGVVGIGSAIGGLFGNEFESDEADAARNFSAHQAQLNRDYGERMSNTAYQRATADMKAAGLNPMLAYQQGGASTPAGSQAATVKGNASNPSPTQLSTAAQIRNTEAQTENINADTDNKRAENPNIVRQGQVQEKTINLLTEQAEQTRAYKELNEEQKKQVEQAILNLKQEVENMRIAGIKMSEEAMLTLALQKLTKERTYGERIANVLELLSVPKAHNEAMAQFSDYMREIAPYTGEVGKVLNSAGAARDMLRPTRRGATIIHHNTRLPKGTQISTP